VADHPHLAALGPLHRNRLGERPHSSTTAGNCHLETAEAFH